MTQGNRLDRRVTWASVGLAVFVLLTALVHARLLADIDYAAGLAVRPLGSELMDAVSGALSIAFSAELSMVYASMIGLLLWRRGFGIWSLAAFAFLAPNALEVLAKMLVLQPSVPPELHRSISYPFASVELRGSYPSGHAVRAWFICTFLAEAIHSSDLGWKWFGGLGLILLGLAVSFTRIYLGDHWLSDVVGGLALGVSTAVLVAGPLFLRPAVNRDDLIAI
ncbi:MAG: phosphatase PAP2 family protein [Dehalococcoidia bacterium]|nr:phosphatase PAP2 family protein [Dehalococcoidia bacterium]